MTIRTKATTRGRLTGALLTLLLILLLLPLCVADGAKAEPAQITQAKREAQELRALIESTSIELEQGRRSLQRCQGKVGGHRGSAREERSAARQN